MMIFNIISNYCKTFNKTIITARQKNKYHNMRNYNVKPIGIFLD